MAHKSRTKEDLQQLKGDALLKIAELEILTGIRYSTIKYYTEQGLLPYEVGGDRLARRFKKDTAAKRLKEILHLKETKRLTIDELKEHFQAKQASE